LVSPPVISSLAAVTTSPPAAALAGRPTPAAPVPRPTPRLRWLDALRGIAVLAVVYEHFGTYLVPGLKLATTQWVHAGTFGVMLFFLVSGYIVPASIERRGNVRDFWIGRVFRLYPAFLVTIAIAALLALLGPGWVPASLSEQPATSVLAHLTMLHEVIGAENLQHQFWTLAYEMVFYLLVTVVFVAGVHRFSAEIAVLLAGAAVALGGVLPSRAFAADGLAVRNLTALTALVLFAGVIMVSARRRAVVIGGAVLLGGFVLTLVGANQRSGAWEGLIILAVMFTGTALYRFHTGQIAAARAVAAVGVVVAAAVGAVHLHGGMWHLVNVSRFPAERAWLGGLLLALAFFGAGILLRHRRVPGWLAWLGAVSYSVYLLHFAVIYLTKGWLVPHQDAPALVRAGLAAAYLAVLLLASGACYRLVELPFQRLGRRLVHRLAHPA
jgi:peptidoglycan/LPS O-acetylase OafA/YrhL